MLSRIPPTAVKTTVKRPTPVAIRNIFAAVTILLEMPAKVLQ